MHLISIKLMIIAVTVFGGGSAKKALIKEKKLTLTEYIETYRDLAIEEMVFSGIPASITMAQGILESAYGNSNLAINANNHFGMKCKPEWTGETITVSGDCYKKYPSNYDSWHDHSLHIMSRKWYADLFKLQQTDYTGWAHGLKKAGYASDPRYAYSLIHLIEQYKLYELDQEALSDW
jgi:flagellum-specific peptidoglycan hydrolase FlgJ